MNDFDVVVVGGGNAGLCSSLAASQAGARVLLIEWAPEGRRGGNTFYAGGGLRFPRAGKDDMLALMPELNIDPASVAINEYTEQEYFNDIAKITQYRSDGDLIQTLVSESRGTVKWLKDLGIRFELSIARHSINVNGVTTFIPGSNVEYSGGGQGLIDGLFGLVDKTDIEVKYRSRLSGLLQDERGAITGVRFLHEDLEHEVRSNSVVLACGGFEANPEMRAQYLGSGWDLARHRGTEFNRGDGHRIALQAGAEATGHWSGCHAVAWELNAPAIRDRSMPHGFERESYPYGIIVNANGERFVDEGADFRPHTYAKNGRAILTQPQQVAYQIFDSKVEHLLINEEYRQKQTTRIERDSISELAKALEIPVPAFTNMIDSFNNAVREGEFDPAVKDGKAALGITPVKSNWAQTLDSPPFAAFPVTCGITFTFGGIKIDTSARVLRPTGDPIPGLFAAGEIVGGIFYHNYPGGTGLMSGAVFGKLAGTGATN